MIVRIFAVWTVAVLLTAFPVVAQQGQRGLGDLQLGSGLQEALRVGTQSAVQLTGRPDGYFRHQAIKILMPKLRGDQGARRSVARVGGRRAENSHQSYCTRH